MPVSSSTVLAHDHFYSDCLRSQLTNKFHIRLVMMSLLLRSNGTRSGASFELDEPRSSSKSEQVFQCRPMHMSLGGQASILQNAETRDRTGDLLIFSLTLSQLSYRGNEMQQKIDFKTSFE